MTRDPFGHQIKQRVLPAKVVLVKLLGEQDARRIPATHAVEQHGGIGLVVYDGSAIVARFKDGIESWWTEEE
ncbi:MAG: hypothetical protein LAO78_01745 [Acidobacteriia bacterium]|nr:hypothetical protein [Terriglobia bacterium]